MKTTKEIIEIIKQQKPNHRSCPAPSLVIPLLTEEDKELPLNAFVDRLCSLYVSTPTETMNQNFLELGCEYEGDIEEERAFDFYMDLKDLLIQAESLTPHAAATLNEDIINTGNYAGLEKDEIEEECVTKNANDDMWLKSSFMQWLRKTKDESVFGAMSLKKLAKHVKQQEKEFPKSAKVFEYFLMEVFEIIESFDKRKWEEEGYEDVTPQQVSEWKSYVAEKIQNWIYETEVFVHKTGGITEKLEELID